MTWTPLERARVEILEERVQALEEVSRVDRRVTEADARKLAEENGWNVEATVLAAAERKLEWAALWHP